MSLWLWYYVSWNIQCVFISVETTSSYLIERPRVTWEHSNNSTSQDFVIILFWIKRHCNSIWDGTLTVDHSGKDSPTDGLDRTGLPRRCTSTRLTSYVSYPLTLKVCFGNTRVERSITCFINHSSSLRLIMLAKGIYWNLHPMVN